MAILHVRNVPNRLHQRIRNLAHGQNRSLSAEVINLLVQAVNDQARAIRRKKIVDEIRSLRFRPRRPLPSSETLVREDRDR